MSSLLRQIDVLPAGCQPWNVDVCAASNERFAYCSTLAIYIYKYDLRFNEYKLESIMSEHRKTITTISWSPFNSDFFVSGSVDPKICVWNVKKQSLVVSFTNARGLIPACIRWHPTEPLTIGFICGRGPLQLLNIESNYDSRKPVDAAVFLSDVSQFCWNHQCSSKLAFGHVDGSISVLWRGKKIDKHNLKPDMVGASSDCDPVVSLKWDTLSSDYLLVLNLNHGIRLIDTENMFMVMRFQLPSAAAHVNSIAWIPSASGMFVSGDTQNGVLRVWNVSRASPLENINLKKTGFHTICLVPRKSCDDNQSLSWNSHVSSTSIAQNPPTAPNSNSACVLPPADLLCTFIDGGVGLYNLDKRKWSFLHPLGHTETIFSCEFQPNNPDMLATASFDGTVKIWDVTKMEAVSMSAGNEGVIYSLTWSPGNMNCIACGTAKKGIFVWDVGKGRIICRFLEHGGNPVYCVSWNHKEPQLLASTCNGGMCIVRNIQGKVVQKYKHPRAVYGCEWSPNNRDMIATSCEDKNIRIFYIAATTDKPLRIFKGHTAKAFLVRWSLLRDGFLCSGSDDMTVRLWDYSEEECVGILRGHTAPVRGLLWNPEVPYLVLSGSWDYTIRIWDTRTLCCLDTVLSHAADVYGLACHPRRPFLVASTSRDSTVRLWSMSYFVQKVSLTILAYGVKSEILGKTIEDGMNPDRSPLLCGQYSRQVILTGAAKEKQTDSLMQKRILECFAVPRGFRNMWDLMAVLCGHDIGVLSPSYKDGIVHIKHLVPLKSSEAHELETIKMSNFGSGGSQRKNDQLRAAANIHIKIGNIQRYCELMVEVGEWDKALSFAPGVSSEYWKSLMERRGNQLIKEGNGASVSYCLATGNIEKLCQFYNSRCEFYNATLVAAAAGSKPNSTPVGNLKKQLNKLGRVNGNDNQKHDETKRDISNTDENKLLTSSLSLLADWHFENNRPVIAACCYLAMNDVKNAMSVLLRSNELESGFILGRILNANGELLKTTAKYLSRRCEKLGRWDLAIDLLKIVDVCQDELWMLCARWSGSDNEITLIHQKAGIPSSKECFEKAEEFLEKQQYFEAIKYYLTSSAPELALDIGLNLLREALLKELWNLNDVNVILSQLTNIKTEEIQSSKLSRQRNDLLITSAYIGALMAIQRKYTPIVILLFSHARYLINKDKTSLPISGLQIEKETKAWLMHSSSSFRVDSENPQEVQDIKKTWDDLKRRIGTSNTGAEEGVVMVVGSCLPNNSNTKNSFLTGEQMKGPIYLLEDDKSMMSLNNALMWAKVNPFSPLASGARINPF